MTTPEGSCRKTSPFGFDLTQQPSPLRVSPLMPGDLGLDSEVVGGEVTAGLGPGPHDAEAPDPPRATCARHSAQAATAGSRPPPG